jgi:hypothetical protein
VRDVESQPPFDLPAPTGPPPPGSRTVVTDDRVEDGLREAG